MTLKTKPVDAGRLKFRYGGCVEHRAWNDGVRSQDQSRDEDTGYPLWKVTASVVYPEAGQIGAVVITVPAKGNPAETAVLDEPIEFAGLSEETWVNNGNSGQRWLATAITTRPGAASSTPPTPGSNKKAEAG